MRWKEEEEEETKKKKKKKKKKRKEEGESVQGGYAGDEGESKKKIEEEWTP